MDTDALILRIVRKEVTKALKEYMETGKKQELAATKIQAAFRGHKTRKSRDVETVTVHKHADFKCSVPKALDLMPPDRPSIDVSTFYVSTENVIECIIFMKTFVIATANSVP